MTVVENHKIAWKSIDFCTPVQILKGFCQIFLDVIGQRSSALHANLQSFMEKTQILKLSETPKLTKKAVVPLLHFIK